MKKQKFVWVFLLWVTAVTGRAEKDIGQGEANQRVLPDTIYGMSRWPDASVLTGGKAMNPADDNAVAVAKNHSWRWIRRVVDASWLPPREEGMVFIRKEFGDWDLSRVAWERNGCRVEVTQTATIFLIKITPQGGVTPENDPGRQFDAARQMCQRVFVREDRIRDHDDYGHSMAVVVPELNVKIADVSFDPSKTKSLPGGRGVAGETSFFRDGQGERFIRSARLRRVSGLDGPGGMGLYWFQNVSWWHDGVAAVFYFARLDGWESSWPEMGGSRDRDWFDASKRGRGRKSIQADKETQP